MAAVCASESGCLRHIRRRMWPLASMVRPGSEGIGIAADILSASVTGPARHRDDHVTIRAALSAQPDDKRQRRDDRPTASTRPSISCAAPSRSPVMSLASTKSP